jgi:hypothetical protein
VLTAAIIREIIGMMMEAVSTSETLVSFYENAWRNIRDVGYHQAPRD